jgi:hypothetical protein
LAQPAHAAVRVFHLEKGANLMTLVVRLLIALVLLLVFAAPRASADIALFDWALNLNGVLYTPGGPPLPGTVDASGFNFTTGLGTITITVTSAGVNNLGLFVDHEMSESVNTFFNEVGSAAGGPPPGVSWEIDEPGYLFGDIYTNFAAGALDNSVGIATPEDVSMAMIQSVIANVGDTVSFGVGLAAPAGFYLTHIDPNSGEQIFFSATPSQVPEPGLPWLLAVGIGIAVVMRRFRIA